jgi:hypothetical protein
MNVSFPPAPPVTVWHSKFYGKDLRAKWSVLLWDTGHLHFATKVNVTVSTKSVRMCTCLCLDLLLTCM